jgi:hypothetical protein
MTTGGMRRHGACPGSEQPPADAEEPTRLHLVPPPTAAVSPAELMLRRLRPDQEEAS